MNDQDPIVFPAGRKPRRRRHTPTPAGPTTADIAADLEPYRVVMARNSVGLTRAELAERLGGRITPARLALIECGAAGLYAYEVEKLAEVTGHLVAYFKRGRPMPYFSASDLFICGSSDVDQQ